MFYRNYALNNIPNCSIYHQDTVACVKWYSRIDIDQFEYANNESTYHCQSNHFQSRNSWPQPLSISSPTPFNLRSFAQCHCRLWYALEHRQPRTKHHSNSQTSKMLCVATRIVVIIDDSRRLRCWRLDSTTHARAHFQLGDKCVCYTIGAMCYVLRVQKQCSHSSLRA